MSASNADFASIPEVSPTEATAKLVEMKKSLREDAGNMIAKTIPRRIFELNEVLGSPDFKLTYDQYASPVNVPSPPGTNEEKEAGDSQFLATGRVNGTTLLMLPDGVIQMNKTLERLHEVVKPLIVQQVDDCNLLKMWIQLLIPKVEDGNNFGVGIQEECLEQVTAVQKDSASYLDQVTRYYILRAKSVSKVAKYPHVEDFRRTVVELDQKQYHTVTMFVRQLRNDYSLLHDILTKNMEKIQRPRNSNAESLY
ncbi:proteasome activator complex subunit 3 [Galendromus occidentalis]|uniref:Proteasome activator complex subunit 3 n=1 Tax=Galendromus occidentalis TaxID=34638 RepID=A0AAJ6QVZ9_9ACAR|nr:proteasome activator complex subunit 3 [Galendromus occidentalis]